MFRRRRPTDPLVKLARLQLEELRLIRDLLVRIVRKLLAEDTPPRRVPTAAFLTVDDPQPE